MTREQEILLKMAKKALSADTSSDLISRDDAIEALRGLFDMRKSRAKVIVECFSELLKALPSAETHEICTETHGVCSDLISRADAIEAVAGLVASEYVVKDGEHGFYTCASVAQNVLSALPSADAISRKALNDVKFVAIKGDKVEEAYRSGWNGAIECIIENAPSADAEQRWIPCSERLPDDLAEVNVTWVNHDPEPYYDFVKDKPASASAVFYKGKWFWYSSVCADILAEYGKNDTDEVDNAIEILAWMPLPKPYKGGDDE